MNPQQIIEDLHQFNGTEQYYRYHNMLLTDGVMYLAQNTNCFWLLDIIWSHVICEKWLGKEDFITCKLSVSGGSGKVIFDDGNGNVLASQKIPYTDFPLERIDLYIVSQEAQFVVMLPSEY